MLRLTIHAHGYRRAHVSISDRRSSLRSAVGQGIRDARGTLRIGYRLRRVRARRFPSVRWDGESYGTAEGGPMIPILITFGALIAMSIVLVAVYGVLTLGRVKKYSEETVETDWVRVK